MNTRVNTPRWTRQALPVLILLLCAAPAGAQGIPDLFLPNPPERASLTPRQARLLEVIEQRPGAEDVELRQAQNPRALTALSAVALRVGEERVQVAQERVAAAHGERFLWEGRFGEGGEALLVVDGDEITGSVQKPSGEMFKIEPLGGGLHTVSRIDQTAIGECGTEDNTEQDQSRGTGSGSLPESSGSDGFTYGVTSSSPTIDVLVVYTPAANNASANIGNEIALAAADMNNGFGNSDVPATVSVVHTAQVSYVETGDFLTDVNRLRGTSDGYMDSVHNLRTQYGADVVILFVDANTSVYGRVYDIGKGAAEAFAVVEWDYATGNHTFAHEIGHLAGARHDNDPNTQPYPYGHGYRPGGQSWRTIMATGSPGSSPFRINYWSNPDKAYGGVAMGTTSYNDNVRAWENSASAMAAFKAPPGPLTASILGPASVATGETNTWTRSVNGGTWPYAYRWDYMYICAEDDPCGGSQPVCLSSDGPASERLGDRSPQGAGESAGLGGAFLLGPDCGKWNDGGTASALTVALTGGGTGQVEIRLRVTDAVGTVVWATHYVSVSESQLVSESWRAGSGEAGTGAVPSDPEVASHHATSLRSGTFPEAYALYMASPNPLRGRAEVAYDLAEAASVSLAVYDMLGRAVAQLVEGPQEAGRHRASFDGSGLPSGVYVVRLAARGAREEYVEAVRVTVVR